MLLQKIIEHCSEKKIKLILLASILFLAFFLRFWNLGEIDLRGDPETRYMALPVMKALDDPSISGFSTVGLPGGKKPPGYYWLIVASFSIFGKNEFAVRFPSAFFGFLSVVAIFFFSRKYINEPVAYLSAFLLATLPFHVNYSRMAYIEPTLAFYSLLTLYLLLEMKHRKSYIYLSSLFIALILLTKFFEGILPLLCLVPYVFVTYAHDKEERKSCINWTLRLISAFLLGLLIFLIWPIYLSITKVGLEYLQAKGFSSVWELIYAYSGGGGGKFYAENPFYWFFISVMARNSGGYLFVPLMFGSLLLLYRAVIDRHSYSLLTLSWFWIPFLLISYGVRGTWHFSMVAIPYAVVGAYAFIRLLKAYIEKSREGKLFPLFIASTIGYIYFVIWTLDVWLLKLLSSNSSVANLLPVQLSNTLVAYIKNTEISQLTLLLVKAAPLLIIFLLLLTFILSLRYYSTKESVRRITSKLAYAIFISIMLLFAFVPLYNTIFAHHVLGENAYNFYRDYSDEMSKYVAGNIANEKYAVAAENLEVVKTYLMFHNSPTTEVLPVGYVLESQNLEMLSKQLAEGDESIIDSIKNGKVRYVILSVKKPATLFIPATKSHPVLFEWVSKNCENINKKAGAPESSKYRLFDCKPLF